MGRFILKRTLHIILIMFLFVTITFLIFQITPGDVTQRFYDNPNLTMESVARIKAQFGLDDPWYMQYFRYVKNVFTLDFGSSLSQFPTPVWDIIKDAIPRTFVLFLTSTLVAFIIGFLMGKIVAWRRGSLVDSAATVVGITFWTMFYPLAAIINIWFFGYILDWLPLGGFTDPYLWMDISGGLTVNKIFGYMILSGFILLGLWLVAWAIARKPNISGKMKKMIIYITPLVLIFLIIIAWAISGFGKYALDIIKHIILPILTLTLLSFGGTMLLTRDSMMETIQEDYVMAAKAKGLPEKTVRDKYAARAALLPVVTNLTLSIGFIMSGGVITETLFSWPGIGRTLLNATMQQDVPLAIGAFCFTGFFVLVAHLISDLLYAFLDPRISIDHQG